MTGTRPATRGPRAKPEDGRIPRFHLAVPVDDLAAARRFYGDILGLDAGRSADTWVDWNLNGHQLVTHVAPSGSWIHNSVDGHDVPVPHFGLILSVSEFHDLADRLRASQIEFIISPHVRFAGELGEQWTMFFTDPAGNAIEFKAFAHDDQVFAAAPATTKPSEGKSTLGDGGCG